MVMHVRLTVLTRCLVLCVCCVYLLQNIYLFLFLTAEKTSAQAPVVRKPEPTKKAPVVRKPEPTKKAPVVHKPEPTKKAPVNKPEPTEKPPVVCKHYNHRYPVASNGKLLDVAVVAESTQEKPKQSTQKRPRSSDQVVQYVAKKGKDRGLLECPKCGSKHKNDPRWVCCPRCFVVIHKTCLSSKGCVCEYILVH